MLAVNNIDLAPEEDLAPRLEKFQALVKKEAGPSPISAVLGDGLPELVDLLIESCPVRPPEFEEGQVTDLYEREIASDLIREAALLKLRD